MILCTSIIYQCSIKNDHIFDTLLAVTKFTTKLEFMRIGLVIADFESNFTTSFKHTARIKYDVDFIDSNIGSITEKMQELQLLVQTPGKQVHVAYDFTIQDVEHIQKLIEKILSKYREVFSPNISPKKKIYDLFQKLREAEIPTPDELATQALSNILKPTTAPRTTRKEKINVDAEVKSKQRLLAAIKKQSAKNAKNGS